MWRAWCLWVSVTIKLSASKSKHGWSPDPKLRIEYDMTRTPHRPARLHYLALITCLELSYKMYMYYQEYFCRETFSDTLITKIFLQRIYRGSNSWAVDGPNSKLVKHFSIINKTWWLLVNRCDHSNMSMKLQTITV